MSVAEFLRELRHSKVRIRLDGGELRCKAPKGVLTKELAADIAARKAEIIAFLQSIEADADEITRPSAFPRSGALPLSFAQERLWFINWLEPASSAYNLTASHRVHEAVDLELFQQALNQVVVRHEILRTSFPSRGDGKPVQVIGPPYTVPLLVQDLRKQSLEEREEALHGIARAESHELFELETGPLFRARIVLLGDEEFVLYVSVPHIVADGWSMGVLLEQLGGIYAALRSRTADNQPELKLQYADFVLWQRSWLHGERLDRLLEYWQRQVSGAPLMLPFLEQRRRRKTKEATGAVETFALTADVSERIKQFGRRLQVTDFVTLFSVYALVLARYSAVSNVLIGTPVANRNWLEFEDLIGLFVNTMALHADCADSQTVAQFLRRNHRMLLESYSHQDLPFEKLVEAVNPERVPGVPPIFQVTFAYQNTPLGSAIEMISGGSMFDLTCYLHDTPEGFKGSFEYNTAILDRATVRKLIDSFKALAARIAQDKQTRLSELSVLSATQQERLLQDWNNTAVAVDQETTVTARFESVARSLPDATALVAGEQKLSYAELNARSNRLAHWLMHQGVRPGDRVVLCLQRSLDLVVAILAALKARAVYVPLDPAYPAERLRLLIADSNPRLVLAGRRVALPEISGDVGVIRLDEIADELDSESSVNPDGSDDGSQSAYIMYTSGSTGTPKGVLVTHGNILRLVVGSDYVDFGPEQVFLLLAPAHFDASTFEIWGGLLHGASCVVYPERVPSVAELGRHIEEYAVTGLFLTTALFNTIIDTRPELLRPLDWLLFGGEAHSMDHVRRALAALPDTRLSQVYGPTECTTFATAHRLSGGIPSGQDSVPIGAPIANTTAYVLDDKGRLSPPGVTGELYLGGQGVAAGYWQRPELTAERFVSLSLGGAPAQRLYRTGDLVRWLASGELEFVGRRDFQVKIRGFRVELGEIEAALREDPMVADTVVLLREDAPGDKRLVAYVVAAKGKEFNEDKLRQSLATRLPEYMLPSVFVSMADLPLTPTGKIDRRALPDPSNCARRQPEAKQRPRSAIEVQIAALWEQALDREGIGVDENFFELGGNSLIAVRLFVQLEQMTGKKLPLATLFEAPTIRALARMIESDGWVPRWDCLVGIQPLGDRNPIFLVPGVGGNVLSYARLSKLLGNEQPVYGLQSRGLDGKQAPFTRAEAMAAHFIEEIRTVRPHGPYILGGACMGGIVAYEMAQQLQRAGEEVSILMLIETASPTTLKPGQRKIRTLIHPLVFLFQAAKRHLRALRDLDFGGKYRYVRDKLRIVGEMVRRRDVYRGDRSIFYQDMVSNANYEVMANYVPASYPGRLHLFLASERRIDPAKDTRLNWGELAEGGFSVTRIDATDSGQLLVEPWVSILVTQIQHRITEQPPGN